MIITEKNNKQLLSRVSHEKAQLEERIREVQEEKERYRYKYREMIQMIRRGAPYSKMIRFFEKGEKEVMSEDEDLFYEEEGKERVRPHENMMQNDVKVTPVHLHRELMKLLKKEYSLTELYRYELGESNEVTKEVKEFNQELLKDQRYLDKNIKYY